MMSIKKSAQSIFFFNRLNKDVTDLKRQRTWYFLSASLVCLILYSFYAYAVSRGLGLMDESFYLTITDRLSKGDRFILDEWHLVQLSAIFQYIPYRIFVLINGSTEGIVLYMRYVYLFLSFLTYWYIIFKLREDPIRGIISAFVFCSYVPFSTFAINYYSLPPILFLITCFLVTGKEGKYQSIRLFSAGVLFSGIVIMVPGMAVVWLLYCLLVLLRLIEKNKGKNNLLSYDFILNLHVFLRILSGVLVSAVLFIAALQISCGIDNIIKMLPHLFTDSEYNVGSEGNVYRFFLRKTNYALQIYNPYVCVFAAITTLLLPAIKRYGKTQRVKALGFALFNLSILMMLIRGFCYKVIKGDAALTTFFIDTPLPIAWLSLGYHIFCKERNHKLFFFWIAGLSLSLSKDFLSDVSYANGLILCVFPLFYYIPKIKEEFYEKKSTKNNNRNPDKQALRFPKKTSRQYQSVKKITAVMISAILFWSLSNTFYEAKHLGKYETDGIKSCTEKITEGAYKNIYTSPELALYYSETLNDVKLAKSMSDKSIFLFGMIPYGYLYLDEAYSPYSTYFVDRDAKTRNESYWQLHPGKRPDVIYLLLETNDVFDNAKAFMTENLVSSRDQSRIDLKWFSGIATKGKRGLIVKVETWDQPTE